MDQSNNLAAGFNHLWAASGLPTLVTGGLQWSAEHMKAGPINGMRPYGQLWVKMSEHRRWTSGLSYIQQYDIECKVWAGSNNVTLKAIDAALDALLPITTKFEAAASGGFLTENAQTVHVTLAGEGIDQEESRANQQNIGMVMKRWRVTLNETRSAA